MNFRHPFIRRLIRLAIEEDLGRGDVTSEGLSLSGEAMTARIVAREALVVAGLPIVAVIAEEAGEAEADVELLVAEGMAVGADTVLLRLYAEPSMLLATERVILNFLQRMCGVATVTRRYVEAVQGTAARIVDTRKTVPGWRLLDKYAVVQGGGRNHRFGLDDGILLKDNHLVAAGGIAPAVARAKAAHHLLPIEVECDTLAQVEEALAAGVDAILLDNMGPADLGAAVKRVAGRALVEASGGVTLPRVREIAKTGVDIISVGAITHSAPAVDLSMELGPVQVH